MLNIKAVQGATVSPDGSQVIYTVAQWESEQDPSTPLAEGNVAQDAMERRTRVWKVATNGSSPARQITFGEKGDSQPQWSPDGKHISFVSSRGSAEAKSQIYLMHADGGEAWKLTDAKENVSAYSWSPDGSRIAYVTTDPRSADEEANIKKRDDERVFEGDFRYQHAWVVDVDHEAGDAHHRRHAPTRCRARRRGRPMASASCSAPRATPMLRDNRRDIYIADVDDASRSRRSARTGATTRQPRWSPDGTHHRVGDRAEHHARRCPTAPRRA